MELVYIYLENFNNITIIHNFPCIFLFIFLNFALLDPLGIHVDPDPEPCL